MAPELHIASMVVHCMPQRLPAAIEGLNLLPGVRVHAGAEGKAVVTLEGASSDEITAIVERVRQIDGVLSAALVYQCADTLAVMNEEMPDAQA
jgi:nitrate reductase NapD